MATAVTPELEAHAKQLPSIEGTVVGVTSGGLMLLNPSGESNHKMVTVRQWGYAVDPKLLSLSVLGREINCVVLYESDEFLGGDCTIRFFPNFETERRWRNQDDLSSISRYYGTSLTHYLKSLGIGHYSCSDEDRHFFSEMPQGPPYRRDYQLERCDFFDKRKLEQDTQ